MNGMNGITVHLNTAAGNFWNSSSAVFAVRTDVLTKPATV